MRVVVLLSLVACGFPKPTDKCEGPCALYSIDHPIATAGAEIWLEGTFEAGAVVNFPGAAQPQALDFYDLDHRASTSVPADATAGELTVTTSEGTTIGLPFRRTTFGLTLQPLMSVNEQNDYARTNYLARVHVGSAALTVGNRVYLIGGSVDGAITGDVEAASAGLDGGLGRPRPAGQLQLARVGHTVLRVGNWVYVIGGNGTGPMREVERTMITSDGKLGTFEIDPDVKLVEGRTGHASAILGNYVYVFGGRDAAGEIATIERAPILDTSGKLGTFQRLDIKLTLARSNFTVAQNGTYLFAIGGLHGGAATNSIERLALDGALGTRDFEMGAGNLVEARSHHACIVIGTEVYVIGGKGAGRTLTSIEVATLPNTDALQFSAQRDYLRLNEPKQEAALALVGNYLYVLGGMHVGTGQDGNSKVVERGALIYGGMLQPFARSTIAMTIGRSQHASMVIGNRLYVIGGLENGMPQDSVEASEIKPDGTLAGFGEVTKLKKARYGHSVLINNDTVYVLGGFQSSTVITDSIEYAMINEDGTLGDFNAYSPPTSWAFGRANFTIFASGTYAYLLGGHDAANVTQATDTIDRIRFVTGTILNFDNSSFMSTLVQARAGAASIALGSHLYVISGKGTSNYVGTARAPLFTDDSGLAQDFMLFGVDPKGLREGHRVVNVGNAFYILGGNSDAAVQANESTQIAVDGSYGTFMSSSLVLTTPRSYHTVVTLGNYVYVIGGQSAAGPSMSSIETATIE